MPSPDLSKRCRQCGVDHPLSEFYSDRRATDGLDSSCKASRHAQRAQRREADLEAHRARSRRYSAAARARNPRRSRKSPNPPVDPQKHRARSALSAAIRRAVIRPDRCESCGIPGPVDGHHHHGYDREHYYDVEWLCSTCHGERHRAVA